MKPLKLEFEGINSFSEHTIIDFERLTRSGIFGIFGDTGSGKSTILDCINFALYGKVERSREKTDIINYRCTVASVKFTFNIINQGKRKTYLVERTIKKDKSGTHKAFLYEDDICIADKPLEVEKKVIEILGVEAEDFRKCIALPQGEFAQFVKSAPRERLALIERLFSLSKYGDRLKEKIAACQSEIEGEYQNLKGRLAFYNNVTAEFEAETFAHLKTIKNKLECFNKEAVKSAARYATIKELYDKKAELEVVLSKIGVLEAKKPVMEELRKGLAVLPICRRAVECDGLIKETTERLDDVRSRLERLTGELSENLKSVEELERFIKEADFDKRIGEYTKLSARYQTCAGKPERLEELKKQLVLKREEYKKVEKTVEELLKEREEALKAVKELEALVGDGKSEELEKFVNTEFRGAILRGEYVSMLDYFADLNARIEMYDDGSKLYSFIKAELKNRIEIYKQRILDVKDFKLENVNEQFELLQKAIKEREDNSQKLRVAAQKLSDVEGKIKVKQSELASLKKDGVELRKRADDLTDELKNIYGEGITDFAQIEKSNLLSLEKVKAEQRKLVAELDNANKKSAQLNVECEKFKVLEKSLNERLLHLKAELADLVEKSGLKGVEACAALSAKFTSTEAEKELKEFDSAYAALIARREELSKAEGIDIITQDNLIQAEKAKLDAERAAVTLSGEVAVIQSKLDDLRIKLEEKNALLEQFKGVEKRHKLILQLKEVTKSNKFLEFIANEYLYEISANASSTLLKLTDGRYFLTYKDNNFSIGDNFNCGELRGVNTLSGGETFLVSLSLALSLSQAICARSLKSIEFFFLDEGFGTLDSKLVDTVMSALEKLKSSQFTIGVISHVEELKHRIDSKITVIKATESHGSCVQLSC